MSFLQPLLLAGLPLISLPIIIHLINQQRHRTINWGAMMFLLDAKRMTRGMARIRHILIMAMRMLAVAGLIFAVSRPLASGWIGLAAGGAADTTLILLDRSPSMEQQNLQTSESKRSASLDKIRDLLKTLGDTSKVVLIENTRSEPIELDSAETLTQFPAVDASSTSSDIPGMLQTALDYITANQTGRTDVWLCSDLKRNDWDSESGRWSSLRQSFSQLKGVRFHLMAFTDSAPDNVSVEVRNVRRRQTPDVTELVLDVILRRDPEQKTPQPVPLTFVINGARSVLEVEMTEPDYTLQGHTIPLDGETETGWGSVEIPNDSNPQDNRFYFAFSAPEPRHTVIVSDDPVTADPIKLAASAATDPGIKFTAEVLPSDRIEEIDWSAAALVIWHSQLPEGVIAKRVQNFVNDGRTILFLPPSSPNATEFLGLKWTTWQKADIDEPFEPGGWRGDSDLLANTLNGAALPVGDSRIYQCCPPEGEGNVLARLESGLPLLQRASTDAGGVYFCGTLPQASHSSLARDGVVFFVMLHRALEAGASSMGKARHLTAGSSAIPDISQAEVQSEHEQLILSSDRGYHAGVLKLDEKLIALNRSIDEDSLVTVDVGEMEKLFGGLDYHVVEEQLGSGMSLAREIWRTFLVMMALALIIEAGLCLPPKPEPEAEAAA